MHFASFPSYAELVTLLDCMIRENGLLLRRENIGTTIAGNKVEAVHVGCDDIAPEEKEVVLIVCGRHGDEIGTRVVGPAVLDWLLSAEAAPVLERQHVIIVPVANPDGCEKREFGLPTDRLSRLEEETVLLLADRCIPDVVIDVHSLGRQKRGMDWGGLQAIVIDSAVEAGEDRQIIFKMALAAIETAYAQGEFFLLHDVAFYRRRALTVAAAKSAAFNDYLNRACYQRFHTLNFGLEVNHFVRTPDEVARSAVAAVQSLLRQGNRRFVGERHTGYPNRLLKGDYLAALRAAGETSSERRRARRNLWPGIADWNLSREMPNAETVRIHIRFAGREKDTGGAELSFFSFGRPPREVRLNGETVSCQFAAESCGTHVFVSLEDLPIDRGVEIVAYR